MKKCVVCGNAYDKWIEVKADGKSYIFDCFECAIHKLAPVCNHCKCKIIGHGTEVKGTYYCCAHCAKEEGSFGVVDRV